MKRKLLYLFMAVSIIAIHMWVGYSVYTMERDILTRREETEHWLGRRERYR